MRILLTMATLSAAALLSTAVYSATCCMDACEEDSNKLCDGAKDTRACLAEHANDTSAGCKTYLDHEQEQQRYGEALEQQKIDEQNALSTKGFKPAKTRAEKKKEAQQQQQQK